MTVCVCDYFCALLSYWQQMQTLFRELRQKINQSDDVDILCVTTCNGAKNVTKNLFPFHQMAPRRGDIAETED